MQPIVVGLCPVSKGALAVAVKREREAGSRRMRAIVGCLDPDKVEAFAAVHGHDATIAMIYGGHHRGFQP